MSEHALDQLAALVAERLARRGPVDRVTLTKTEAAEALGVSVDHFERHVQPELRLIHSGRLVLVPVRELERWADRHAAVTLRNAA
jgi:excisionase family DNA binding protein